MDRVKTSLFDILRPELDGMRLLDLFAGSGSVGIEALSQGAAACTFLDLGHKAVATIKKNLEFTGLGDRAVVRQADALAFLRSTSERFDLIYVAPPQYKDLWLEALRHIAARPDLFREQPSNDDDADSATAVIAQIDPKEYAELELGWLVETRKKRYGNTLLVFYERAEGTPARAGEQP
jgi:16S rRNA (guanine(966)-N(2))-methyltransferase RsmD